MTDQPSVKGTASYFPAIEKKYGHRTERWMHILVAAGPMKHMKLVKLLKTDHGLGHGHGHANASAAAFLAAS